MWMMQGVVNTFATTMFWLVVLLSSIVVVLLLAATRHLGALRGRARFGIFALVLVLIATTICQFLLAAHHPQGGPLLSQLLLPLLLPLLLLSIYRLSFPPLDPSPASLPSQRRQLLLFSLTLTMLILEGCLVLLDLLIL